MIKAKTMEKDGDIGVRVEVEGNTVDLIEEFRAITQALFMNMKDESLPLFALMEAMKEGTEAGLGIEEEEDGEPETDDIRASEEARFDHLS